MCSENFAKLNVLQENGFHKYQMMLKEREEDVYRVYVDIRYDAMRDIYK